MDPLFSKKFEEAKAEALAKLVKQPEELISRNGRWALTSDSYRRWLYLTDCIRMSTVEIPVPMLGDDVISQVIWDGDEVEVGGWNGSFRFTPKIDWGKGKPMQRGLRLLLNEFRIVGPQLLEYQQDCIRVRCRIMPAYTAERGPEENVEIGLSGISLLGVYDLETEFSPDQWYELASVQEEDEDGETVTLRRIIWTAGERLHMALVQEVEVSWENVEELDPDLDHIFHMMPWREGFMSDEDMDLFVKTYAEIEGEELLPEVLESLERYLADYRNPRLNLVKLFFETDKSIMDQEYAWGARLQLLHEALKKRGNNDQ